VRLRTVTLVNRLVHGGAERLAYQLVRDLDPERFERTLCVSRADDPGHAVAGSEPARWIEQLRADGVRVVELRRRGRADVAAWAPLVRVLRDSDVLHAHMFGSNVWASALGPALRVPVVISHEHAFAHTGGRFQAAIDRHVVARGSRALIAPSPRVRQRMVDDDGVPADRVLVLPNGVEARLPTPGRDLRAELGIDPGAPVVGSVGSLRQIKRFDVLVAAAERLRRTHPGVQVLIAGDGPERDALNRAITERGLTRTVRMLGARSDVPDVLAACDVAVSCSDAEASPLAVMEYMGAALPTVATAVGGVPDVIADGVHGTLVPRRDPVALADAVAALLDDPVWRHALGRAASDRRRAEFDLPVMVRRVEQLYERLYRATARPAQSPRRRRRGGQLGTTDAGVEIPKT
jgi:glycosyltransferase involved in cell wall biosynthesis